MPISGPILAQLIYAEMLSAGMTGQYTFKMAQAVGNGVIITVLSSAVYNGISTGFAIGAGTSVGTLSGSIVIGKTVGSLIFTSMTSLGLVGQKSQQFAGAIGNAVANHMSMAIVQGASVPVAIGSGTGIISGVVVPLMTNNILMQMSMMGFTGQKIFQLAQGISIGVCTAIQMSVATTSITGIAIGTVPPALPPIPMSGTDTGKIV